MPDKQIFSDCLQRMISEQKKARHRRLVVLEEAVEWSIAQLSYFLSQEALRSAIYGIAINVNNVKRIENFKHALGQEYDIVIFADEHFHPDAFAALSGTLAAGGLMIWLCPDMSYFSAKNAFYQRFCQQIIADKDTIVINRQTLAQVKIEPKKSHIETPYNDSLGCAHQQQAEAVNQVIKVVSGHRRRPLVLTADRGRGKSSALAIAAVQVMLLTNKRLIVTAPHRNALAIFFEQLISSYPQGYYQQDSFYIANSSIQFVPVDKLVAEQPENHLVLVDEAAAIPIYLLERLAQQNSRIVFSSTVHGYEGSGRGFSLKFIKKLSAIAPDYNRYHIKQAIRWAEDDPLERFIFNTFLLNAALPEIPASDIETFSIAHTDIRLVDAKELILDEKLLNQIVAILVTAHYQTSPSDVKLMLAQEQVKLFVTFDRQLDIAIAVSLCLTEGEASERDIALMTASQKQLKSQFLPQSLMKYCADQSAFNFRYLRIVRIAVVESLQQKGLGRQLLQYIKAFCQHNQYDILGTSFGANHELVSFWGEQQMMPVRIGFNRDSASGEHSCLMLHGISDLGRDHVTHLSTIFYQQLPYCLAEQYAELSTDLVSCLLSQGHHLAEHLAITRLNKRDEFIVKQFALGHYQYDPSAFSLSNWLLSVLITHPYLADQTDLLVAKVLQRKTTARIANDFGYTGKKALQLALKESVNSILAQMS
ncbi:GNAT family N-acetyltransferase [Thalassotalea ganghwensis]